MEDGRGDRRRDREWGSDRQLPAILRGGLQTAAICLGFAFGGLTWAAVEQSATPRAVPPARSYPLRSMSATSDPPASAPVIWLVDGYNVLHAAILRGRDRALWWTEPRRRQLLEAASRFDDDSADIWVVFDGEGESARGESARDETEVPAVPERTRCVFAPSADDWLVDRVRRSEDPSQLAVVTADRQVAGRAAHRGAQVVSPRTFLARCTPNDTLETKPPTPSRLGPS